MDMSSQLHVPPLNLPVPTPYEVGWAPELAWTRKQSADVLFGPRREEVKRNWRKLPTEKLHHSYSTPKNIRMIK